jgi:BolA protein
VRVNEITAAIRGAIQADSVLIIDESHLHHGHAGARPFGQSHYKATVVSAVFDGKSRVERQRMVFAAIGDAVGNEIHALTLNLQTPAQAASSKLEVEIR